MNQLKKLNAIHKGIMAFVASEVVEKAGELSEGWNKEKHIQHNSDFLRGQINIFQRQLPNTLNAWKWRYRFNQKIFRNVQKR